MKGEIAYIKKKKKKVMDGEQRVREGQHSVSLQHKLKSVYNAQGNTWHLSLD